MLGLEKKDITNMPISGFQRMMGATLFQKSSMKKLKLWSVGPYEMSGKTVFITGGNGGIGFETAKNLLDYGATVVIGCRRHEAALEAVKSLQEHLILEKKNQNNISFVIMDLADIDSIKDCCLKLCQSNLKFDVLILNGAVMPTSYSENKQGYELAYATNVLGNYAVVSQFFENKLLKEVENVKSRVVVVTGDIYVTAKDCSTNYKYKTDISSMTYARSKLGLNWITMELQKKYAEAPVEFILLHPGVISTSLAKSVYSSIKDIVFISAEKGAQLSLFCCCESGVVNVLDGYYHNTYGLVKFQKGDPMDNEKRQKEVFQECEEIYKEYNI